MIKIIPFFKHLLLTLTIVFLSSIVIAQPLSGTYTIDYTGSGDYVSFTAAVTDLTTNGVSGATIFEVIDGTYTEHITLTNFTGVSSTNTITFRSQQGNAANVIMEYSATSSAVNYVVNFNSAKYISFQNITLKALNWAFGKVITNDNTSGNRFISVDGCNLEGVVTTNTWSSDMYVVHLTGGDNDYLTLSNNTILNGNYGLNWSGNGQVYDSNNVCSNNEFVNQYIRGVLFYNQANVEFNHNHIVSNSTHQYAYGFYLGGLKLGEINGNYIEGTTNWPRFALYLSNVEGGVSSFLQVKNNRIFMPATIGANGVHIAQGFFVEFYNNSVYVASSSATSNAFYMFNGSFNRVKNNIFVHGGSGHGVSLNGSPVYQMDYNNITAVNGNTGYTSASFSTLADWQLATGFDSNSYEVNNVFSDVVSLKVCTDSLYGKGIGLPSVSLDFENDPRQNPPCIGADEFQPSSYFGMDDQVLCNGDTLILTQNYYDTVVWNFIDTSNSYAVYNIGQIIVQGFGGCGNSSDTINILPAVTSSLGNVNLCEGTSQVLSTGVSNATFLWSNGSTDSTIVVDSAQIVTVTITDSVGCVFIGTSVVTQSVNVDLPDSVTFCKNDSVMLSVNIPGVYMWSSGQTSSFIYVSVAGQYSVTVTEQNCVSSDNAEAVEQLSPIAFFNDSVDHYTVAFTNMSQYADSFLWDFGDGTTSNVKHPTHIYPWSTDTVICHNVTLVAYSSCGVDSFSQIHYISTIGSYTPDFNVQVTGLSATFSFTSFNPTSYIWAFGDGDSSTLANPTHVYSPTGAYECYQVTLIVENGCGTEYIYKTIAVGNYPANDPCNLINGIANIGEATTVSVYPNPTNGLFNVNVITSAASEMVVEVIDVRGSVIFNKSYGVVSGNVNQVIELPEISSGVYVVKVTLNNESTFLKLSVN